MRLYNTTHFRRYYSKPEVNVICNRIPVYKSSLKVVRYKPDIYKRTQVREYQISDIKVLYPEMAENLIEDDIAYGGIIPDTTDAWVDCYNLDLVKEPSESYKRTQKLNIISNKLARSSFVKKFNSMWVGKEFKEL